MKILHIADLKKMGGLEWILADFVNKTSDTEEIQHIILCEKSGEISSTISNIISTKCIGTYKSKKYGPITLPKLPASIRKWNRRRLIKKTECDIVIIWSQFFDFGKHEFTKKPIIHYEHGLAWFEHDRDLIKSYFKQITACINVSNAAMRILQLKYHIKNDSYIVLNALRPSLSNNKEKPRQLGEKIINLGIAARLVPLKCIGLFILTIKELRSIGVQSTGIISGTGPEHDSLKSLTEELGLTNEIKFTGFIENMADFYKEVDIYINTSMHEACPLVCIEAMSFGIPVISGDIEGAHELITDGIDGVLIKPTLPPDIYHTKSKQSIDFSKEIYNVDTDSISKPMLVDPKKIAAAVNTLTNNHHLYEKLSTNAIKKANENFTFERQYKEITKILKKYI